ncbi:MAG: hypothetical protein R3E01_17705 [Pirellulaceae bacterium]
MSKPLFAFIVIALHLATLPDAWCAQQRHLLDEGWQFALGDVHVEGDARVALHGWRNVDLPHDWSIELATRETAPSGGGGGYFQTGIGWYRRNLEVPDAWRNRRS